MSIEEKHIAEKYRKDKLSIHCIFSNLSSVRQNLSSNYKYVHRII